MRIFKKKTLFVAIYVVWCSQVSGQNLISVQTDSLIKLGINLTIRQAYDQAFLIFKTMQRATPESPAGYFFHAAALQSQMMDYEDYREEADFFELVKTTVELSALYRKRNPGDPWGYFFEGGGYAYLAFYKAKKGKYFEAFQSGTRGVRVLEQALKVDSTLYDAYFGLGTYKYYRSKLSRHFSWLPFVNDDREEGIRMIKKAMQKSRYSKFSAINGYFWIALEEENFDEAEQVLAPALAEFPHSRVFLWCAAKLAARRQRWQEAATYFEEILDSHRQAGTLSPYNEIVCRKNLYEAYAHLGRRDLAETQCARIAEVHLPGEAPAGHKQAMKEALGLCERLPTELGGSQK